MSDLNESQARLARTLDGMVVVDAGPGTGKTHTIVERYLNLVSRPDVSPGDVLMLTFTNNAASEMEERIKGSMTDRGMLKESKLVQTSTFDAFCRSILMDSPETAGSFFGISERLTRGAEVVSNDTLNETWFSSFLDDFLAERGEDFGDAAIVASQYPKDILALINRLMSKGVFPLKRGWFGIDPSRDLLGDTEGVLEDLRRLNEPSAKTGVSQAWKAIHEKAPKEGFDPLPQSEGVLDETDLADAAGEDRSGLLDLIHAVYHEYIRKSIASDRLTFGLTSMLAFSLLYDDGRIRQRNSFRYVMIDEFQDTNAIQLMISMMVLSEPNLCAVGDWKQGIYGFRFVSIHNIVEFEERMVSMRRFLNEDKVRVPFGIPSVSRLSLDVNYRSSEPIVRNAFESLFIRGTEKEEIDVERLEEKVVRLKADTDGRIGDLTETRFVRCDGRDREPEAVARCVLDYVQSDREIADGDVRRPVGLGDIAVFCRTTSGCAKVLDGLTSAGIPAYLEGDADIMSTREGKLLLAWLRYVNNDRDPWGFVPIMADMGYTLVECRAARDDPSAVPASIVAARRDLYLKRRRVTEMLTTVFSLYGIDNDVSQAIITTLSTAHRGSLLTISDLIGMIEKDIASGSRYPFEGSIDRDAVKIMTMHKAKGLEFPVVIIPYMDRGIMPLRPGSGGAYLYDDRIGIRCAYSVGRFDGYSKLCRSWRTALVAASGSRDYSEERRLLFVAASRAKQYQTFICSDPSPFIEGLSGGVYEGPPAPMARTFDSSTTAAARPDLSGYRPRSPRFAVHDLMDLSTEDGMGGMSEKNHEVCGKGPEYGDAVHSAAEIIFDGNEPPEDYPELGMVRSIVERAHCAVDSRAETDCVLPIAGTDVVLRGRIDLLADFGDVVEVHDYKTDASDRFQAEYEFQLSVYGLAASLHYGKPARCFIDYVSLGRTVEFDPMTMDELRDEVLRRMNRMGLSKD